MRPGNIYLGVSIAIVIAVGSYAVLVYSSPQNKTGQPEKIYFYPSGYWEPEDPRFIKITDMQPNSYGHFMYPSSFKIGDPGNAYQTFLLIRLPTLLGGGKDDVSAFRAYSVVDLTSHCVVAYWPEEDRMRIEDPCSGDKYRMLDGYLSEIGGSSILLQDNALPKLDLYADKEGYLYVLTPTWTEDKNGVIGIGRHLSTDQIQQTTQFIENQTKVSENYQMSKFPIPTSLVSGEVVISDEVDGYKETVHYQKTGDSNHDVLLIVHFCNCIDYERLLKSKINSNSEMWKYGDNFIVATPRQGGITGSSNYVFEFYKDRYNLFFATEGSFDHGIGMVIDNFFNGTSLSKLQKFPLNRTLNSSS